MEEAVNEKMIDFIFRGTSVGVDTIKAAINKYLEIRENRENRKAASKAAKAQKVEEPKRGKMSLDELMKQNAGESRIDITDKTLHSFDRVARKYHIDYAVIKEKAAKGSENEKPTFHVIFKARDSDVMDLAFKKYVKKNEKKQNRANNRPKEPIKEILAKAKARSEELANKIDKFKKRSRGKNKEIVR